jgi:hypothetical protein
MFPKPWDHKPPLGKFLFFRGRALHSLISGDSSYFMARENKSDNIFLLKK